MNIPLMFLASTGEKMSFGPALLTAIMGYAFVFFGILLLMAVIIVTGKVMSSKKAEEKAAPAAPAAPAAEPEKPKAPAAPGTAGELKLYDTDPKTAAMIMAIVADKMGKPINELRFKSIKEVKQ